MIVDHRIYTFKPGTIGEQLKFYEETGLGPQTRHLGQPVGYYVVETGPLNQIIHMWGYDSAGDREKKRAAMQADPEWQSYLKASRERGYLLAQENRLITPAPFFKPPR